MMQGRYVRDSGAGTRIDEKYALENASSMRLKDHENLARDVRQLQSLCEQEAVALSNYIQDMAKAYDELRFRMEGLEK